MPNHQILGLECFRVGEWNGDKYSLEDVKSIAESYPKLGYKAPIVIGHNSDRGSVDEKPAHGWVERVYMKGERLLCDVTDVTDELFAAIKKKMYNAVSIEVFWNIKRGAETFRRCLKAVAVLGGSVPAVSHLRPISEATLLGQRTIFKTYSMPFRQEAPTMPSYSESNLPPDQIAHLRAQALIDAGIFSQKDYAHAVTRVLAEDNALRVAYSQFTSIRE